MINIFNPFVGNYVTQFNECQKQLFSIRDLFTLQLQSGTIMMQTWNKMIKF